MPLTLSNISGIGNFTLLNNTNIGRLDMSVAAAVTSSAITSGLIMNLDAGNISSYPGSGTSWTDTVGSKVFTLAGTIGTPTYN